MQANLRFRLQKKCPARILPCLISHTRSLAAFFLCRSSQLVQHTLTGAAGCPTAWPVYLTSVQARRSYGFDPFGLGQVPSNLQRFQEAELVHCRWAMLGAAGALAPELLGFGDWYSAPQWVRN